MNLTQALDIIGGLSRTSKMPGYSFGLPAQACVTGSKLVGVPGSTCNGCYALKGLYHTGTVKKAQAKRLKLLQTALSSKKGKREWVGAFVTLLSPGTRYSKEPYFRWHDSGDLQSEHHLRVIMDIADELPSIRFWLPTREYKMVKHVSVDRCQPHNLTTRLSAHMVNTEGPVHLGFFTSTVHTHDHESWALSFASGNVCPAPNQGGQCKNCRSCWEEGFSNISYLKH